MSEKIESAKTAGSAFEPADEALLTSAEVKAGVLKAGITDQEVSTLNALARKYDDEIKIGSVNLYFKNVKAYVLEALKKFSPGEDSGLGTDILLAYLAESNLSRNQQLSATQLAEYRAAIRHPAILEALETKNSLSQKVLTGGLPAEANIISPIKDAQDKILESLLGKFAGKVVYIDFWAPWCGPCMGEMPNSKVLKKELAGKDVVFLYLGVNCSKESWEKAIKTSSIEGEHYLLSKNEYALLSERFQISGIPRYLLIDKSGKVADAQAKRPGEKAALLQDINTLLE